MKKYVIYKVTNLVNKKVYVGFDSKWPRRKSQHKHSSIYSRGTTNVFYNAIRKYGWENFKWEVIYESSDGEHTLKVMEPHFIQEYNSYTYKENTNGYNMTLGGEGTLGHKKPLASLISQSEKMRGRKQTPEHILRKTRSRMSNPNNVVWQKGKTKYTDDRIARAAEKISKSLRGKPKSDKHKQSMKNRIQDISLLTCPHCDKVGDYKNMRRWHMDRCKLNPETARTEPKQVTCNSCGVTTNENPNFYKNHNERCRMNKIKKDIGTE